MARGYDNRDADVMVMHYDFRAMIIWISMLRGVNVGPHNRVKMEALRDVYASLKLEQVQTFVQSGNVIFRTREKNAPTLARKIQNAIKLALGFSPEVVLRTAEELKTVIANSPFAGRQDVEPGRLLVTFLVDDPGEDGRSALSSLKDYPEELHLKGRELYIYFPEGAGKSKLPWSKVEKLFKTQGTARNWNSITKMLGIAEKLADRN